MVKKKSRERKAPKKSMDVTPTKALAAWDGGGAPVEVEELARVKKPTTVHGIRRLSEAIRREVSPEELAAKARMLLESSDLKHVAFALAWLADRGWGKAPIVMTDFDSPDGPRPVDLAAIVEATIQTSRRRDAALERYGMERGYAGGVRR